MFYDHYVELCRQRGISPSRAAINAGLSKSTVTKWKQRPDARPAGRALEQLCRYFNVSASEMLGEETPEEKLSGGTEEALKVALFGGSREVTDEMLQEVLSFADFVRQREEKKTARK